ncbi:protein of unassigned function [Methylobacterium oryzae CBMB20]|uniref:Protein of unassigned function n=1 Tax=Methylobacterium oryzae CBMB20 TaxID=693986 RepID=A0A089NTQ2_9HYPH|nr:protein of unassigned function [Methylobacterium oryzae CBMB20]
MPHRVGLARSEAETPIRLTTLRDLARGVRKRAVPPRSTRKPPA